MNNTQIFRIKRNDTLPKLQVNVITKGTLGQLEGYSFIDTGTTATFTMVDDCSNTKVYDQPVQIICISGGTLQYSWQESDTDTEGIYYGEFKITFSSGDKISIPTQGGIKIEILKDINPF